MRFDSTVYGDEVARILALAGNNERLMPLASPTCVSREARQQLENARASDLFPGRPSPEGALAGLWTYLGCFDEAHQVAQDLNTREGSFWHGILHRQEPDPGNAAYWFRRVGAHPVFGALQQEAEELAAQYPSHGFTLGRVWDPFAFIDLCEQARRKPGSPAEQFARAVQQSEWQLLFDYCARPRETRA